MNNVRNREREEIESAENGESIVRLHKATEENTKSLIIKETKFLAKLVGE